MAIRPSDSTNSNLNDLHEETNEEQRRLAEAIFDYEEVIMMEPP